MLRCLLLIFFLLYSFVFSNTSKEESSFFGHWSLDIKKSLAANTLPKNSINDLQKILKQLQQSKNKRIKKNLSI